MAELRWVLLALGVLVIVAVYLWSQGILQRWLAPISTLTRRRRGDHERIEPGLSAPDPEPPVEVPTVPDPEPEPEPEFSLAPEVVVTIRFIPTAKQIASDKVVLALRAAGLRHGRYEIFHKFPSELDDEPVFSVASLTEPGSFDLSSLSETKIAGMSFFMVLPGAGNPVDRFDEMVSVARELARELDGDLRDDKGSSWSIQRERYVREEIIEYCRQHARSAV